MEDARARADAENFILFCMAEETRTEFQKSGSYKKKK
jgi:hypothetical protein